jgi:hypothetical protein
MGVASNLIELRKRLGRAVTTEYAIRPLFSMEGVMVIRKTQYRAVFIILAVALFILNVHSLYAADELYLTGIVKDIDHATRIVVVDVKSSSCHGIRKFSVDDASKLDDFVNERIDFSIDSSTCKSDEVYKMFIGGRKER